MPERRRGGLLPAYEFAFLFGDRLMAENLVSTQDLALLPDIEALRKRMQQMAALAAVVGIDFDVPPYAFHPAWSQGEQMGAYKNGSGDELFAHFTPAGCFIKGFAHESNMSPYRTQPPTPWPGLFNGVPDAFASSLNEPAFDIPATTFVIWRLTNDAQWQIGPVRFPAEDMYGDGSQDLLRQVVMSAAEFAEWLAENYEAEVDAEIVASVFDHRPLTKAQLSALQPASEIADLMRVVEETGFPLG